MNERFVVPRDVTLIPVSQLASDVRERLGARPGDVALERPGVRSSAKLLDASTAALLREFRRPRTLAQAIVRIANARGENARALVPSAYKALSQLVSGGFLVEEGSPLADEIVPRLRAGDDFPPYRVRRCVRLMSDVELYLALDSSGRPVALKIWRLPADAIAPAARREASVLAELGGVDAPALLLDGSASATPFIAMEWCQGVHASEAADEDVDLSHDARSARLWRLACAVAEAYARLHERGILHGDVNDSNVLVDRDDSIRLLDFGLARRLDHVGEDLPRGGVLEYFEPEYAASALAGRPAPAATPQGEQYGVAAMIFRVVAGMHCLALRPSERDAMRQIATERARSFSECGAIPWPALEGVLQRALRKNPDDRFPSMRDFARAIHAAGVNEAVPEVVSPAVNGQRYADLSATWRAVDATSDVYDAGYASAPACSIAYGTAGVSLAWYRRSLISDSPAHLGVARQFAALARAHRHEARAFHDGIELTRDNVGPISYLNGSSGVWYVSALVAHASGDVAGASTAVSRWLSAVRTRRRTLDLTLGRAGVVHTAALLIEALRGSGLRAVPHLVRAGRRALGEVWRALDRYGPIGDQCEYANLGIAHGWGGMLYATLRWRTIERLGASRERTVKRRLAELAACAQPAGRGLSWPWRSAPVSPGAYETYAPGWCNGSAGLVHLWLEAHAAYGDATSLELASGAAWHAWEAADDGAESLCCGLSGRAYALLALFRATGDVVWWSRARDLARRASLAAAEHHEPFLSFYRGALGVALLLEEIERPELARMPGFESEGWVGPSYQSNRVASRA